jgi:hypothetical protein
MIRDRIIQTRDKLVGKLPVTGELLRGSLLERWSAPFWRLGRGCSGKSTTGS